MKFFKPYLNYKFLKIFTAYIVLAGSTLFFAYLLRFDFNIPELYFENFKSIVTWYVGIQIAFLFAFGQFDVVFSQFKLPDLFRLFISLILSSSYVLFLWYIYKGEGVPPRSVIITNLLLYFISISALRIFFRIHHNEGFLKWLSGKENIFNVAIIGAGEVGALIGADLISKKRSLGVKPVFYLDDSDEKVGRFLNGIPILDKVCALDKLAAKYSIKKVIIAFPSAPSKRLRAVAEQARNLGLGVESVPALSDIISGRASVTQIKPVQLEDLLGRDIVKLNFSEIRKMLKGQRILITGAGGSIGREILSQTIENDPDALLCIDQSEIAIFDLKFSLIDKHKKRDLVETCILDIKDSKALHYRLKKFSPTIIFHAAAYKHVNLMEDQPIEALNNNFFASVKLMNLASELSVNKFIFISTDKAINPTSVMGVSKRLAEIALQEIQIRKQNSTHFMAVRFGNVLGSSGSVINIFKEQINNGGPLTVTHPDVTRYFMTVREAMGLVLESATKGSGGEIFVLDMGEPIKILDLAKEMIALSGLKEGIDIDIEFSKLKSGEKLYEEVQHLNEVHAKTDHPRIFKFLSKNNPKFTIDEIESNLRKSISNHDTYEIKSTLKNIVKEYTPAK